MPAGILDAHKKAFNLPQLDLPGDEQLSADLMAAATREALQAYIRDWRREGLPAKVTLLQQHSACGAAAAPQAGAAAHRESGRRRKQAHPQQQVQAGTTATPVQGQQEQQEQQAPPRLSSSHPTQQTQQPDRPTHSAGPASAAVLLAAIPSEADAGAAGRLADGRLPLGVASQPLVTPALLVARAAVACVQWQPPGRLS